MHAKKVIYVMFRQYPTITIYQATGVGGGLPCTSVNYTTVRIMCCEKY